MMRWKIKIINIGSKKTRQIKKLKEYIDGIASKIQFFILDLEENEYESEDELERDEEGESTFPTIEEKLLNTGDFILKLQQEILEFKRKKYRF